jgi:hypothetical protein
LIVTVTVPGRSTQAGLMEATMLSSPPEDCLDRFDAERSGG